MKSPRTHDGPKIRVKLSNDRTRSPRQWDDPIGWVTSVTLELKPHPGPRWLAQIVRPLPYSKVWRSLWETRNDSVGWMTMQRSGGPAVRPASPRGDCACGSPVGAGAQDARLSKTASHNRISGYYDNNERGVTHACGKGGALV
jgi:hypothetical protein